METRVGEFVDLIRSKELLRRAKAVEHLAVLYDRFPELAPGVAIRASGPRMMAVAFRILHGSSSQARQATRLVLSVATPEGRGSTQTMTI